MIIYNYFEYIRALFPGEKIYINVAQEPNSQIPDSNVIIEETSSNTETPYFKYVFKTVSFWVRDVDPVLAYQLSWKLFDELSNCYRIELPAVTVNFINYPAVFLDGVNPGQRPYIMGPDNEGRIRFKFSLELRYRRT